MEFKKIFDINNQVEQLTSDIIRSGEIMHFIITNRKGILYITDSQDAISCVESGKYESVGVISRSNNHMYIKDKLIKFINEYNNKLS